MMICKNCFIPMIGVMSFSKDKNEGYYRCPNCKGETKHQKVKDSDLDFGEILRKEIHKKDK